MRAVFSDPSGARVVGKRGEVWVRERYNPEVSIVPCPLGRKTPHLLRWFARYLMLQPCENYSHIVSWDAGARAAC
jgi:hypothetical protein